MGVQICFAPLRRFGCRRWSRGASWRARMPVHDPPLSVTLFQHGGAQTTAINMTRLSVIHYIRGYRVLQSCPSSVTGQMNLHIAEGVLRVLHLTHFRHKVMITIIDPTIIRVATFEYG